MILLIGVKTDPVLRYFFDQNYVKRDRRVLFLNVERIGVDIFLSDEGWMLPTGELLPHSAISSVYSRLVSQIRNPWIYYLNWLLDDVYPNVINRPKDSLVNFSKLWQLEVARDMGFDIPKTQVYANFRLKNRDDGIYKSISSVRSIVKRVENNYQNLVNEPVLFQSDKGRHNIRVHLLKGHYVAQEIFSKEVDYRYDLNACCAKRCDIPIALLDKVKQLSTKFKLVFSGIDFILSNGRYYFLEINPSPGYAYFEKQLSGTPISALLYKTLRENE